MGSAITISQAGSTYGFTKKRTQDMLGSKAKRELQINQRRILIDSLEIGIPSPQQISAWGERRLPNGKKVGEVKNSKTVNYKRFTPLRDGLFCERIFGPVNSFVCACGKRQPRADINFCSKCEVEYTDRRVRRYRLGHIPLISPVVHIWYLKGRPSYLSLFLGKRKKKIVQLAYCNAYLVEQPHSNTSQTDLASAPAEVISSTQEREAHGANIYVRKIPSSSTIRHIADSRVRAHTIAANPQSFESSPPEDRTIPNTSPSSFLELLEEIYGHIRKDVVLTHLPNTNNTPPPERDPVPHVSPNSLTGQTLENNQRAQDSKSSISLYPLWGYTCSERERALTQDRASGHVKPNQENISRANTRFSSYLPRELANPNGIDWQKPVRTFYPNQIENRNSIKNGSGRPDPTNTAANTSVTSPLDHIKNIQTQPLFDAGMQPNPVALPYRPISRTTAQTVQRALSPYNRSHTFPFLPGLICRYNLRDELLRFLYSSESTGDRKIPMYCQLHRSQPLQDVHQFMSEHCVSQFDSSRANHIVAPENGADKLARLTKRLSIYPLGRLYGSPRSRLQLARLERRECTSLERVGSLKHILYLALLQKSKSLQTSRFSTRVSQMSSLLTHISREKIIHESVRASRAAQSYLDLVAQKRGKSLPRLNHKLKSSSSSQSSSFFNFDLQKDLALSKRFQANSYPAGQRLSFYRVRATGIERLASGSTNLLSRELPALYTQSSYMSAQQSDTERWSKIKLLRDLSWRSTLKDASLPERLRVETRKNHFSKATNRSLQDHGMLRFTQLQQPPNLIGLANSLQFQSPEKSYRSLLFDKRWVRAFLLEKHWIEEERGSSSRTNRLPNSPIARKSLIRTPSQIGSCQQARLVPSLLHAFRQSVQEQEQSKKNSSFAEGPLASAARSNLKLDRAAQLVRKDFRVSYRNFAQQNSSIAKKHAKNRIWSYEKRLLNTVYSVSSIFPDSQTTRDAFTSPAGRDGKPFGKADEHRTASCSPLSFFLILPTEHTTRQDGHAHWSSQLPSHSKKKDLQTEGDVTTVQIESGNRNSQLLQLSKVELDGQDLYRTDLSTTERVEGQSSAERPVERSQDDISEVPLQLANSSQVVLNGDDAAVQSSFQDESAYVSPPELTTIREVLSYTGGGALQKLLQRFDVQQFSIFLFADIQATRAIYKRRVAKNGYPRNRVGKRILTRLSRRIYKNSRRLKIAQLLTRCKRRPEWMMISVLPVLPPDLRPIVQMGESVVVASDLNNLYQRVVYRSNRFQKLNVIDFHLVTAIQRLVQDAVDRLIENGKGGSKPFATPSGRPLKSLSDILKGKRGRFRLNLLGKRVDFSARSVIVVAPTLRVHECGLPREIALELYHYFLLRELLLKKKASSIVIAKRVIKRREPFIWHLLRDMIYNHPVLLNRAPTLHRLGIQAFQPQLVQGSAILLNPLVCSGFNADFDGDQMGVHLPLSVQARAEAWDLLWARNNLLSPATGQPVFLPSQDMVLGLYYMTQFFSARSWLSDSAENGRKDLPDSITENRLQPENRLIVRTRAPEQLRLPSRRSCVRTKRVFLTCVELLGALQKKHIQIHTPVWLQWQGEMENDEESQMPLELRLDSFASSVYIYSKYKRRRHESSTQCNTYIRTTAGRVLLNSSVLM